MATRRWSADHLKRIQAMLAGMSRQATAFADTSAPAAEARRSLPFAEWCHVYLPHWFSCDDAPGHAAGDARRNTIGIILAEDWAREMAKTTRYSIADVLYDLLNESRVCRVADGTSIVLTKREAEAREDIASSSRLCFIVLLAATCDKAAERMDLLRIELRHNERVRSDYGDGIAPQWGADTSDDFIANDVCIRGFGIGESLRSQLYNGHRPQKAIADDLENNVIARNPDREDDLRDWLFKDVLPALDGGGQQAVVRVLLNHWGRNCLAAYLRDRAGETVDGKLLILYHRAPRRDEAGNSTWLARHSNAATRRLAAIIGPSRSRTELDCLDANNDARFQPEWFGGYRRNLLEPPQLTAMRKIIWLDSSYKAKSTSDFKAIVCIGRPKRELEVFCLHAWIRRVPSKEAAMELVRTWQAFPDAQVWIEDAGGAEESFKDIFAAMVRAGIAIPYVHYEPTTEAKEDSIGKWEGEISQGLALFDVTECDQAVLVNQFCDFPQGHDDGPDAWAKARGKLGPADLGLGGDRIRFGQRRDDAGALFGLARPREVRMPGSSDDRYDRDHESEFDRLAARSGGIVF